MRFEILQTIAHVAGAGNTAPTTKPPRSSQARGGPPSTRRGRAPGSEPPTLCYRCFDDEDDIIRAGAVGALAQSAAHAHTLITRSRTCFDREPNPWVAERLVLAVGELARYADQAREEAIGWLRLRMSVGGREGNQTSTRISTPGSHGTKKSATTTGSNVHEFTDLDVRRHVIGPPA
ncbi:hypothetical protein [Streptomyces sp. NPDC054854]